MKGSSSTVEGLTYITSPGGPAATVVCLVSACVLPYAYVIDRRK